MLWSGTRGQGVEPAATKKGPPVASRALEWLWQHLRDVPHPHILDCGQVSPATIDVLLRRGAKVYVADLISPLLEGASRFWDRSQKQPVFLLGEFLAQVPEIPSGSLSAVLCWQLLDLFPRAHLPALVVALMAYLQPGGVLFCLLREPYLNTGANLSWHVYGTTSLRVAGEGGARFPSPAITNREMERLAIGGSVRTFLTRAGLREALVVKERDSG